MKTCSKCGEAKPLTDFHRDGPGHKPACKACRCADSRRWDHAHRERNNLMALRWARANPDKAKAARKRWERKNPDKQREAQRRWLAANRERSRRYQREWLAAHPTWASDRWHRRRAREGPTSPKTTRAMAKLMSQPCAYCDSTENITIDHVIPLSRGGQHQPHNLAPACRSCNASKGTKLLREWLGC